MLVFATSDKGGTGRSVTSSNLVYRRALRGDDACYVDFDFGSPTAGAIFQIDDANRGTATGAGLHNYFHSRVADAVRLNVWAQSDRDTLRNAPPTAGQLVLLPGDIGGGEFGSNDERVGLCVKLLLRLEEEYDLTIVDLSAGRSYAADMVLAATAHPAFREVIVKWLVFHRWTKQHIIAAAALVFGKNGIIETAVEQGHRRQKMIDSLRFVRTAVIDPNSADLAGLRPAQVTWMRDNNNELQRLAGQQGVGRTVMLGAIPLDPVLQSREQLISDDDVVLSQIANERTVRAFEELVDSLVDERSWVGL